MPHSGPALLYATPDPTRPDIAKCLLMQASTNTAHKHPAYVVPPMVVGNAAITPTLRESEKFAQPDVDCLYSGHQVFLSDWAVTYVSYPVTGMLLVMHMCSCAAVGRVTQLTQVARQLCEGGSCGESHSDLGRE